MRYHLLISLCYGGMFFQQAVSLSQRSGIKSFTHKFYILRHGETDANAAGIIQGSSDFSRLTSGGRVQARNLGLGLREDTKLCMPSNVYISPLTRAQDTWEIVKSCFEEYIVDANSDIPNKEERLEHILDNLREIDFHSWEGMQKDEIKAKYPKSYAGWKAGDPHGLAVYDDCIQENGEIRILTKFPLLDLWERADNVWNEIHSIESEYMLKQVSNNNDELMSSSSLLVCHGSLGQALLGSAIGRDANFFREEEFPNCGMVEIEWSIHLGSDSDQKGQADRWRWFRPTLLDWNNVENWLL